MKNLFKIPSRQHLAFTIIFIGMLALDQLTKVWVIRSHSLPLYIIRNFFRIIHSENTGIAFSIPIPQIILIPLIMLIIIFGLNALRKEMNLSHPIAFTSIAMILAGALGNLLDRLRLGYVIDFIAIGKFPVFNVADAGITVGIMILMICYSRLKKTR
ncbi:MAG: signal peptidase II [Candidatus Peregrinibacteria bacterium]|nr:signal peptidase II [Candidatus Peregrinibacteria bacterium]